MPDERRSGHSRLVAKAGRIEVERPDDTRSDEQLIEAAHKAVERLNNALYEWQVDSAAAASVARIGGRLRVDHVDTVADDAITALGKRLIQRTEETQAAEDALAHAQELAAPVVSGVLELDSFLQHRGAT